MKENDWLLNTLANPTFTITDFKNVGLNTDNTSLESEDTYKNLPVILEMELLQTDGKFDENKFHQFYISAAYMYNNFTNEKYSEDISKQLLYHRDNIFADINQRQFNPEITFERAPNPLRESSGTIKLGKVYENALSTREIAQREKTLLNPIEYEKGEKPIWGDSPNDSFFKDFFKTRVLAQWDSDGEHIDLVTGKKVKHSKGDLKLNERGTVFYEDLLGRDIYDKLVLSKLDIITTDGSKWNKYDFFDSDDKDKSYIGSLAKLLVTLAPLATPAAPYYIGIGVALQTAKLGATLGKMFTGAFDIDNSTLSSIEGFLKSVEPSVSDASMESVWTVENMLNLVGDVFLQLNQQRWLFKYGPALIKGTKPISDKASYDQQLQKFIDVYKNQDLSKIRDYIAKKGLSSKTVSDLRNIQTIKANLDMENFMKEYNDIGKYLSRAYMTGITTADAYGDAIRQGASGIEAAILTLGYAAAEYGLMSTALGERVLPELRQSRYRYRDIQLKLADIRKFTIESKTGPATKKDKYNWFLKLYKFGYDAATAAKTIGPRTVSTVTANALGEGIEETSEELLYDFIKSIYNSIQYFRGGEYLNVWDDVLDRYSMSFLGGMLGGGLMELNANLRNARQLPEITSQSAMQELVKIVRNNEDGEFLKTLEKNTLGNKDVSFEVVSDPNNKDNYIYKPVDDKNNSLDAIAKKLIRNIVTNIKSVLNSEGAKITDELLIDRMTRHDLKFSGLYNSATSAIYVQKFNSLVSDLSKAATDYNIILNSATDELKSQNDPELEKKLSEKQKEIDVIKEQLLEYTSGKLSSDFIQLGVFEMSQAVRQAYSLPDRISYIESKSGKSIKDLDENTIKTLSTEWEQYKDGKLKDDLQIAYSIHKYIAKTFSKYLSDHKLKYFENADEKQLTLALSLERAILGEYTDISGKNLGVNTISDTTLFLKSALVLVTPDEGIYAFYDLIQKYATPKNKAILEASINGTLQDTPENKLSVEVALQESIQTIAASVINEYKNLGYINPEVKRVLTKVIGIIDQIPYNKRTVKSSDLYNTLNSLQHSNMYELLEQFSLTLGSDVKISNIVSSINEALSSGNVEDFILPAGIEEGLDSALKIINLLEAQILSARVDLADIDNILGLNKTVNEVDPEANLVELGSREADTMLFDLNLIKQRLQFAKILLDVNTGLKIVELDTAAAKVTLILYKKLKNFLLPDDWDTSDWNETMNKLLALQELQSKVENKLSEQERISIKDDGRVLDLAIHDLFSKNADKLKDPESMRKFMANFNLFDSTDQVLDSNITAINDVHVFWYLITRAAVNPKDFYFAYKLIIGTKIAPFYSLELSTYTAFANVVNKEMFQLATQAYNERVADQIRDMSEENRKLYKVSEKFPYSSLYSANNSLITFIQGMPGTGKSAGVFRNVVNLLKITNPDLLKKVWVVHVTEDNAKKLAESLGLENFVAMNKTQYMKKIAPEWSETFNDLGELIIKEDDIKLNDLMVFQSTLDINLSNEASLIIVDEFSTHSYVDVDLETKYSKLHDVSIIAAGDLLQAKITGSISVKVDNIEGIKSVSDDLFIHEQYFVTSPKLGGLLRATSDAMVKSIVSLSTAFNKLQKGENVPDVFSTSTIVEEGPNKGVYGVKIMDSEADDISDITHNIDIMLETLDPTEKIGYVYNDENSELYKILTTTPKYKDKILKFKGTSAQGLESKYYIVEDFITQTTDSAGNLISNWDKYYNDLYTVLTRSKLGCLWVKSLPAYNTSFESIDIETDNPPVRTLSEDAIKKYSQLRKDYLEEHYKEGDLESLKVKTAPKQTKPDVDKQDDDLSNDEGPSNDGLEPTEQVKLKADKSTQKYQLKLPADIAVVNKSGNHFNLLMPSTFARETGFVTTDSKQLVPPSNFDYRLDNLNGLVKLIPNPGKPLQEYLEDLKELLEVLRYYCYTIDDRSILADKINDLLGTGFTDSYVLFFVKSSASDSTKTNNKYYKDKGELLESIYSSGSKSKNHLNKTLSVVFGSEATGDKLEITLLTFPNVLTLLKHELFKELNEEYENIKLRKNKIYDSLVEFRELLQTPKFLGKTGVKEIIDLINLFEFTQNGVFYINHLLPDWTIAKNSASYGIRVINKDKGLDYMSDGYESSKDEWYPLNDFKQDSVIRISDKIYIAPTGVIEAGGKTIKFADPGMPFVLVSETPKDLAEGSLYEKYILELSDTGHSSTVTMIKLVPPSAPIEEYLLNIYNIIHNEKAHIKKLGNDFTAFRLLSLLQNDSRVSWDNVSKEHIFEYLDKLNALDSDKQKEELEELVPIKDVKLGGKRVKVKKFFLAALYNLTYLEGVPTKNLDILKELMKKKNWNGVFYNITYDVSSDASLGSVIEATIDSGSYSIDGHPFYINGKLDKSSYYMDMSQILDMISSKIVRGGKVLKSSDNKIYLSGFSNRVSTPKSIADIFIENSFKMPKKMSDTIKRFSDTNIESLITSLNKKGHLIFDINGKYLVTPKISGLGFDVNKYSSINIEPVDISSSDIATYNILADNDIYTAVIVFDGQSPKSMTLSKQISQDEEPQAVDFSDIDAQITDVSDLLELYEIFDGYLSTDSSYDVQSPETFWESLSQAYLEYKQDNTEQEYNDMILEYDDESTLRQILEKLKAVKSAYNDNYNDSCNNIYIEF